MEIVYLKAQQLENACAALEEVMKGPRMSSVKDHMMLMIMAVAPHIQFELQEFNADEINWAAQGIEANRRALSDFALRLVAVRRMPAEQQEDPRVPVLTAVVNAIGTGALGEQVSPEVIARTLVSALQKAGL
jgi:hypothetical protein